MNILHYLQSTGAVVLTFGMGCGPASARYMTGLALLDWCRDDASTFCPGYIAALADYQKVLQDIDMAPLRFCLPSNVKLAELRKVVIDQLGPLPPDALQAVAADAELRVVLVGDKSRIEPLLASVDNRDRLEIVVLADIHRG